MFPPLKSSPPPPLPLIQPTLQIRERKVFRAHFGQSETLSIHRDSASLYLLPRRWLLLGRSPKAHRVRQVERGESGRTAGLRHGIVLRITTKVSAFHSCQ